MSELRYTVPKQMGEHIKVFFPNIGLTTVREPTQTEMDYAWAFFNLMRKGDWQMFSRITKVGDEFIPCRYPEMDVEVGAPIEDATQISPNVWRREFTQAIAYVNISDAPATVTLPTAGAPLHTALGATVNSSLTLESFKGLTIYKTPWDRASTWWRVKSLAGPASSPPEKLLDPPAAPVRGSDPRHRSFFRSLAMAVRNYPDAVRLSMRNARAGDDSLADRPRDYAAITHPPAALGVSCNRVIIRPGRASPNW